MGYSFPAVMQRPSRSTDHVLVAIVASFSALLIAASLLLLANGRQMSRLLLQYDTSRLASILLEEYVESSELYFTDLSDGILGAGIYGPTGVQLQAQGDVPVAIRPPLTMQTGSEAGAGFVYNRSERTVSLLRPLQLATVLEDRLAGRMPGHRPMPGERPAPGGRLDPDPRVPVPGYTFVVRVDATSFYRTQARYAAGMIAAPLVVIALGFAVGRALVRARRRIDELAGREELARLGEGARTLAHEIKNPLNAIAIRTRVLRGIAGEDAGADLDAVDAEVDRLRRLTDRVGTFLRDPVGTPVQVHIADLVQRVGERNGWDIDLSTEPEGSDPTVLFDETRLESVVSNVLANAVDVQPEGGPIEVRIGRAGGEVVLRVVDRGPGMSADEQARVFDPFYTTKAHGSGVGLAIVKRFVDAVGGEVSIDSDEVGTTVTVRLREEGHDDSRG